MASKAYITPLERVENLLVELSEALFKRSDCYTDVRPSEKSIDDARHRVAVMMQRDGKYHARNPEIIRVELAIALKKIGVDYPQPDS